MRRLGLAVALATSSACAAYTGGGRDFAPARLQREPGWLAAGQVTLVRQHEELDCGPAALAMILTYWARPAARGALRRALPPGPAGGVRAGQLRDLARRSGLQAFLVRGELGDLHHELRGGRP